jgi:hypothetical protein
VTFIQGVTEGGEHYTVASNSSGYSIHSRRSDEEGLNLFQPIVEKLRRDDGEGYEIVKEHESSECGSHLVEPA